MSCLRSANEVLIFLDLFKTTFTLEFHVVVWYSYHFSIKLAYYKRAALI